MPLLRVDFFHALTQHFAMIARPVVHLGIGLVFQRRLGLLTSYLDFGLRDNYCALCKKFLLS